MAVRKQTGKRLQRVRAFPNFIDWSWRTPEELRQKLGRFEKALRGMFADLGGLLLKVVDGNRSPDYTHEGVDTVRFVGTGVSLSKTREGYVTVTITDTNTVVDDHGTLNGLADDDHTQYLLVDGTRALGGNWSLGNFNLTNANELTFNGAGSFINNLAQLDFLASGGGFIRFLDTLTMFDSGSYIDGNDGQLRDFSRLDRTTGVLAIEAEGGDVTVDASDDIFLRPDDALVGQVGGTFQVTAGGAITLFNSGANNISLTAGSALDLNGASLDVDTTGGAEIDAGSDIHIRGTRLNLVASSSDIDLTASRVDFNNNPAERVAHVQINDGDSMSGQPDAGTVEIGAYSGPDSSDPGGMLAVFSRYFLWHFPVSVESATGLSGGNNLQVTIDFSSLRGYDFSDSTLRVGVHLQSTRTDGSEAQYSGQDEHAVFYVTTNQSGNMEMSLKEQGDGIGSTQTQFWCADNGSTVPNIAWSETGASTVVITGTIQGTGTRRGIMVTEIEFAHVP